MAPISSWHHKQKHLAQSSQQPQPAVLAVAPLWTKAFVHVFLLNLALNCCAHMYTSTFPFYIKHLGGTELWVGLAAGGLSIFALFMRPMAGWALDNLSRRVFLMLGIAGTLLISLCYLALPFLGLVILLRCLSGFCHATTTTSSNTIACDIVPPSRFGEGISMFGLTNSLSMAAGPVMGLLVMQWLGYQALFVTVVLLAMLCYVLARQLEYKPVGKKAGLTPQPLNLHNLFNKDALPAGVVAMFGAVPYGGMAAFIALYAEEYQIGGASAAGLYFTLVACGTATMRLFSGKLADRRGEGLVVYIGSTLIMLSSLVLVMPARWIYYGSALCYGFGFGICGPALQAMAVRIVPLERRGSASSTYLCAFDIGIGVGGPIAGAWVTWFGYRSMFVMLGVFALISILAYAFWASKSPSAFKNAMRQKAQNALEGSQA